MIVVQCEQGSAEWFQARAGVITASMFSEIRKTVNGLTDQQKKYVDTLLDGKSEAEAKEIAGYKKAPTGEKIQRALDGERVGDYTEKALNYALKLSIERISGVALQDDNFQTYAMRRGHELEPEARDLHSFRINKDIERTGIILTDDGKFGASADGLIGKDGGSEYKCLTSPDALRPILLDGDFTDYYDQCMGGLALSGRKWWHLGIYCPALSLIGKELIVHEVRRHDDYIDSMWADLLAFDALVENYRERVIDERKAA